MSQAMGAELRLLTSGSNEEHCITCNKLKACFHCWPFSEALMVEQ